MKSKKDIENVANAENTENLGNDEIVDNVPSTRKKYGGLRSFLLNSRLKASEFFD